jgi:hypothetical protein
VLLSEVISQMNSFPPVSTGVVVLIDVVAGVVVVGDEVLTGVVTGVVAGLVAGSVVSGAVQPIHEKTINATRTTGRT